MIDGMKLSKHMPSTYLDTVDLDVVSPALICMYILMYDCAEELNTRKGSLSPCFEL